MRKVVDLEAATRDADRESADVDRALDLIGTLSLGQCAEDGPRSMRRETKMAIARIARTPATANADVAEKPEAAEPGKQCHVLTTA